MNTEKKKRNAGSKIAIIVIIVYLLLPLVMTLIYSCLLYTSDAADEL